VNATVVADSLTYLDADVVVSTATVTFSAVSVLEQHQLHLEEPQEFIVGVRLSRIYRL
jgi:hypothetical protein